MKKFAFPALALLLALSACNTVAGAGQDASSVGRGVTNGANAVGNTMANP